MATDAEGQRFEDVDWDTIDTARINPTPERAVLLIGLSILITLYLYDTYVAHVYFLFDWQLNRIDWLTLIGTVMIVAYVGVPALRNRKTTVRTIHQLLSRPTTAVASGVLGLVVLVGLLGPVAPGSAELRFDRSFHPPYGASIPNAAVGNCQGEVTSAEDTILRTCEGTLSVYPFGANSDGIPMEVLIADGARVALYVAVFTIAFVIPLATAIGVIAGLRGGLIDDVLMSYVDVQLSIPAIIVYVIGYMYWNTSLLLLLVTFGLPSWGGIARLVRSEVLQRREDGYVMVARSFGGPPSYIARRHLLPNITNTLLPAVFQLIALLILVEAGVAFLGFQEAFVYSWGETIANGIRQDSMPPVSVDGREIGPHDVWWVATFPALALSLTLVSCKLVGDGLRDALDPRAEH